MWIRPPAARALGVLASLLAVTPADGPGILAAERGPVEFAEPRPDKALVYFVRTSRFAGGPGTMWLYADQTFVGVMDGGTYGYSYVDPGRRLFWTNWGGATRELELVTGETYYLDVWKDIGVLDEARGRALIEKVGERVSPDEDEVARSVKHIRKRYPRAVQRESFKDRLPIEEVAAPPPPADTEGLLKVPAYAVVEIELLETVTSEFSPAGTEVCFRVAEDASVDGQIFVRRGAIVKGVVRESDQAGGLGKAGVLEIVVPSLTAGDGTIIPLVAQLAGAGKNREDVVAIFQLGVLPALAVRGREAYHLAGERFRARTRAEVWVKPMGPPAVEGDGAVSATGAPPATMGDGTPGAGKAVADSVKVAADVAKTIRFTPRKGYRPDDVRLLLRAASEPAEVWIERIGTTVLPAPIRASAIARQGDAWACDFDGWSVVRFMQPRGGQGATPIVLRGRLGDGRSFSGEAAASLEMDLE